MYVLIAVVVVSALVTAADDDTAAVATAVAAAVVVTVAVAVPLRHVVVVGRRGRGRCGCTDCVIVTVDAAAVVVVAGLAWRVVLVVDGQQRLLVLAHVDYEVVRVEYAAVALRLQLVHAHLMLMQLTAAESTRAAGLLVARHGRLDQLRHGHCVRVARVGAATVAWHDHLALTEAHGYLHSRVVVVVVVVVVV